MKRQKGKLLISKGFMDGFLFGLSGPASFFYPLDKHVDISALTVRSAWSRVGDSLNSAMREEGKLVEERKNKPSKGASSARSGSRVAA